MYTRVCVCVAATAAFLCKLNRREKGLVGRRQEGGREKSSVFRTRFKLVCLEMDGARKRPDENAYVCRRTPLGPQKYVRSHYILPTRCRFHAIAILVMSVRFLRVRVDVKISLGNNRVVICVARKTILTDQT